MKQSLDLVISEIERRIKEYQASGDAYWFPVNRELKELVSFINDLKGNSSYGYYLFDTPLEVCQFMANLRNKELISITYAGKYIVFYAETIKPISGTSFETSSELR